MGALAVLGMGTLLGIAWALTRRPVRVEHVLPADTPPHMIDAQWRVLDAHMARNGYELEDTRRRR